MGPVIGTLAVVVAVLGLLAALGYGGFLVLQRSIASQRPGADASARDATKHLPGAGGLVLGALLALLLTGAESTTVDLIGLLAGGGVGLGSLAQLQAARKRLDRPAP